ncbi:hypothetical protein A3F03_01495 [Candidatus Roizmanbacteria bacterium RIFCSPHIGHO2_12_FULL_41_11]|uniref:Uncharacterized protein n=3 Tax=Candidatus Roizmaniibacteriota TaxID=1752723 RepID=A0A1F7JRW4_9BACT|nr:MAG: hypothetical protein A3F03_01495 [Candidatus Roizmanbacteria bacterium RIFCSPHIGHO2_12_FULL_41_11]OGK52296.1 MAG: hypothetical protein A2966_03310 [Candidatus Roizmanbacteria bacterium RIFCSPLOWO2_01_FULL_41_22]OGK58327.1 MAG: hypothetical protein A3H86_03885 [Candidatus Roizmanbacteria bacterium RIFCSPLOWO2_02_FULL_41_9]
MVKKIVYLSTLLLLPLIFVFDLLIFLTTKVTCLSCQMGEYFRNSSLTITLVNQVWQTIYQPSKKSAR